MCAEDFGVCKTFISAKGVIRTAFERNMKYSDEFNHGSDHLMPVTVTYEYKLKNNLFAVFFEDFGLLELRPAKFDMRADDGGSWQGLDAGSLAAEELGDIKDSVRFGKISYPMHLAMDKISDVTVLPKMVKHLTTNMSVSEVRKYISNLLQQKKEAGESSYILRAGDLLKELGLINATPTVCDAMTKKINYKYDIIFAPPKGKSTKLTVRYYL